MSPKTEKAKELNRVAIAHHKIAKHNFWTAKCLRDLMDTPWVEGALRASGVDDGCVQSYAKDIVPKTTHSEYQTRFKIFAILVLQYKGRAIETFINHKIFDNDLPFRDDHDEDGQPFLKCGNNETRIPQDDCECCVPWRDDPNLVKGFVSTQFHVCAPVFGFDEQGKLRHQDLHGDIILPWTKPEPRSKAIHINTIHSGGFGEVEQVYMHSDSHRFHHRLASINHKNCFAVKKLKTKEHYEQEFEMLKPLSTVDHTNLIVLLTTFTHMETYHLMFPYAECDLERYFESQRNPRGGSDTAKMELSRWFSDQIVGMTEALSILHNKGFEVWDDVKKRTIPKYGRHGDIKPQNVLWFPSPKRGVCGGNLVLTDFGIGTFKSAHSRTTNVPGAGISMTPNYRPPECDMSGGRLSRLFDVWTLGCVFLEMVCWALEGEEGRRAFESDRKTTTYRVNGKDHHVATFFEILEWTNTGDKPSYRFVVKEAVTKLIRRLHDSSDCTGFINDFLQVIQKDMIVVDLGDHRRRSTAELLPNLEKIRGSAKTDDGYVTKRHPVCTSDCQFEPLPFAAEPNDHAFREMKFTKMDSRELSTPVSGMSAREVTNALKEHDEL